MASAQTVVVEVRRTFASPECDSGEVLINGVLVSLFQSDPAMFAPPDAAKRIIDGELSAELHKADYHYSPMQSLVVRDKAGQTAFRIVMLNNGSFTPFSRRKRVRQLPAGEIVTGYSVQNRDCSVTSQPADTKFNDDDARLSLTSDLFGVAAFGKPDLARDFPFSDKRPIVLVLTDRSHRIRLEYAGHIYEAGFPAATAATLGSDSPCLFKGEHMSNTIIRPGSQTYERRDDVVTCPVGALDGKATIEARRDIRYYSMWDLVPCSSMLGLPLHRIRYVARGKEGQGKGGAVHTQCPGGSLTQDASESSWTVE